MRRWLALCGVLAGLVAVMVPRTARADQDVDQSGETTVLPAGAHIEIAPRPPEPRNASETPADVDAEGIAEAPPPRRRHKGVVLESSLGVLGFAGQFRHVAPPALWLHAQLGYEFLDWLMLFGEGELAFTDTGESQDASRSLAFPLWGVGGGARVTIHATPRFAMFGQAQIDGLVAAVPHNALTVLGFRKAETLAASFGVRLGAEWYQIDRHLALCAQVGVRDAQGFSKVTASNDTPIMWDVALGIRYTF